MNEKEIIEGNRLIAEFMGYKYYPDDTLNGIKGVLRHPERLSLHLDINKRGCAEYHTDWNELMPVVEKIETTTNPESTYKDHTMIVSIETGYCLVSENGEAPVCEFIADESETKIQTVWKLVVSFINWYNLSKN